MFDVREDCDVGDFVNRPGERVWKECSGGRLTSQWGGGEI